MLSDIIRCNNNQIAKVEKNGFRISAKEDILLTE